MDPSWNKQSVCATVGERLTLTADLVLSNHDPIFTGCDNGIDLILNVTY